jgi:LmbE family N-acetylglucosaminyl deacetylase
MRIAAIHADDIELGCGGLLLKAAITLIQYHKITNV